MLFCLKNYKVAWDNIFENKTLFYIFSVLKGQSLKILKTAKKSQKNKTYNLSWWALLGFYDIWFEWELAVNLCEQTMTSCITL